MPKYQINWHDDVNTGTYVTKDVKDDLRAVFEFIGDIGDSAIIDDIAEYNTKPDFVVDWDNIDWANLVHSEVPLEQPKMSMDTPDMYKLWYIMDFLREYAKDRDIEIVFNNHGRVAFIEDTGTFDNIEFETAMDAYEVLKARENFYDTVERCSVSAGG